MVISFVKTHNLLFMLHAIYFVSKTISKLEGCGWGGKEMGSWLREGKGGIGREKVKDITEAQFRRRFLGCIIVDVEIVSQHQIFHENFRASKFHL